MAVLIYRDFLMLKMRKANVDDFANFMKLNAEVQSIHAKNRPDKFKDPKDVTVTYDDFNNIVTSDSKFLIFAILNDSVVGYVLMELKDCEGPFTKGKKVLYIDHISVLSRAKGKGLGKALIEEAKTLAKSLGIKTLELDVWSFNNEACSFFEKCGFKPYNVKMELDI